ncbi:MAG: hypothetical protein HYR55_18790 [Acidobacteria bacterium]|nr:hypothetical protein [Acidobacteriota bacterium]MBI3656544.1 hypothetical protein [Acidobacteriota bacterium]
MKKSLLVLAAVSLLAVGCTQEQAVVNPIPTKKIPQSKVDTSKWKLYQDENISFRYPSDWRVAVQKSGNGVALGLLDQKKLYHLKGGYPVPPIGIDYYPDEYGGSIDRLLNKDVSRRPLKKETTLVGGKPAYVLYGSLPSAFINDRVVFTNRLKFEFHSNGHNLGYLDIDDIFETVLSTVNFP